MFTSIAHSYDLNNSLLSFGLHHRWKRLAVDRAQIQPGETALDLCAGTGDLALLLGKKAGRHGMVAALDLNEPMLQIGRRKIREGRLEEQAKCIVGNADTLPFSRNTFHGVTVAFGIRNVTEVKKTLDEIHRVLRPGGRLVCLEFSVPKNPWVRKFYDLYSFYWIPWLASILSGDKTGTYRYLPASIRAFHDPESLKSLLADCGFSGIVYENLSLGIVAVHTGLKPVA